MASSVADRLWCLHLRSAPPRRLTRAVLGTFRIGRSSRWELRVRASSGGDGGWIGKGRVAAERTVGRLREAVAAVPPVAVAIKQKVGSNLVISLSVVIAILVVIVRMLIMRKRNRSQNGSVADLVKRGYLRSDRRGISKPLKYEDPFNNPLVKVHKSDSKVEMFGKVYRMAPVALTEELQSSHRMRRSRAYKWKRPTIFVKEGDDIPPDVDLDTVRWIPANHPFATTDSDIDENLAQSNVFQTNGVPFRIKAEHEALQRKLEALQSEQKLNQIALTPNNIRNIELQSKSSSLKDEKPDVSSSVDPKFGQNNKKSHSAQDSSNITHLQEDLKMP